MLALRGREPVILPYPLQNLATKAMRARAADRNDIRYIALWAGQGSGLARDLPAADLVRWLVHESDELARRLNSKD